LGVATYTHFTSPIRRYADLVVHRSLLAELGEEAFRNAHRHSQLEGLAKHLNERTRTAKKLSRKADDVCFVSLLRYRLRETELEREMTGVIVGMSGHGCYVRVDCAEGMLSGRDLGGNANEEQTVWQTGDEDSVSRELRLGETIEVRVKNLDPVRGQLRLVLS
jgi:ribonuclease R